MKFWEVERKTGDAYIDGLLWAIGFISRFAAVSVILLLICAISHADADGLRRFGIAAVGVIVLLLVHCEA